MQINTYKCPSCNAPVGKDDLSCEFCGAEITKMHNGKILVPVKDFGAKGIGYLSLILFVAIAIYIAGWFFEDTEYWLNTNAVLLWTVALPFWILITTITWSCKWGAVLYGIIVSVAVFISHIIIMGYFENWNFNDDYFGISGVFAGGVLAAWLIGRLIHSLIRKSMNKHL